MPEKDPYELHDLIEHVEDLLIEACPHAALFAIAQAFEISADEAAAGIDQRYSNA
jgi:hypothetical protein